MSADVMPHHVNIVMPDLRAMSQGPQIDPDVSATLTDFLAYTEHLPSTVIRSMTLIGEQDRVASEQQQRLHNLLSIYSSLPSLKGQAGIPDAATLRRDISHAWAILERARRMAAAESVRMADMIHRDQTRLDIITTKLKHLPRPPSRDPTPEPVSSPQLKKAQPATEKRSAHRVGSAPRVHGRKIMVPGEVLPPPNPDSPEASDISEDDSLPPSPKLDKKQLKVLNKALGRPRTPVPPKIPKEKKERTPKPARARPVGQLGTNVHSAVAGISTSNALLALIAPPANALPGSKWLPWKRITEFELAKLRKRMKKNAIWLPSPAMRNRELKLLGRGQQALEAAKRRLEASGEPYLDEFGPDWIDPTRAMLSEDAQLELAGMLEREISNPEDEALMNRGMLLNEAKKRKRERMMEEQAIQAQLNAEAIAEGRVELIDVVGEHIDVKPVTTKKRKRDTTMVPSLKADDALPSSPDVLASAPKRLKLSIPLRAQEQGTPSVSASGRSPLKPSSRPPSAIALDVPASAGRRASLKLNLKRNKAASAEPPNRRLHLRRGSNASLPGDNGPGRAGSIDGRRASSSATAHAAATTTTSTTTSGRRRRPAPGLVTAAEDGRAKVSVGKRKAAPKKKARAAAAIAAAANTAGEAVDESEVMDADPDEERYCLCGDVSWGTMIACDNDDCDKQWFHLSCVDLDDMPPRRTKWFCPDCRHKLKKGRDTNGIVRA